MKLYKYRTLNDLWRILDIIVNKRFYVPRWEDLNDPMENRYHQVSSLVELYLKACGENLDDLYLDPENYIGINQLIIDTMGGKITQKTTKYEEYMRQYYHTYDRILSFSGNPSNFLMWSHYGDSHKGIVIEVDVPDYFIENNFVESEFDCGNYGFQSAKVVYKKKLDFKISFHSKKIDALLKKEDDYNLMLHMQETIYNIYMQKLDIWQYENEYRFITGHKEEYFDLELFEAKITKVILGINVESYKVSILKEIIPANISIVKTECKNGKVVELK